MTRVIKSTKLLGAIFFVSIILAGLGTQVAKAFDVMFYGGNDITHYNPDAVCGGPAAPGSGGPANIDVDKGFSLGTDPKERRVNLVKALMKDYGLTGEQASGIVGNFMVESGGQQLPPDVNEGGRAGPPAFKGGYGWAQWTGGRQKAFIDFAVKNGYMTSAAVNGTDAANYAWLKNDLNTAYKSTITQIKTKTTPEDAAISFEATFERAGVPALAKRTASARQVFTELNGGTSTSGGTTTTVAATCPAVGGGASIVGDKAFPLKTTKAAMDSKNPGMFKNGTASKGGHPYTAFDILADPGTEIVAFLSGTVTHIGEDKCPGRLVSIFNQEANLTISYLHMNLNASTHVAAGATVTVGQHVGVVGPPSAGCGVAHLHIDAAQGNTRPGCKRESCPAENAAKFFDIGPDLFKTYEALP